jgi:endonuclease/exonuclease/phosphatase family metal-dependent hydrolase
MQRRSVPRLCIFVYYGDMARFSNDLRFCAILFIVAFLSCQSRHDRIGMPPHFSGTIPDTLTVMSYNVENMFDMTDNGDEYPEYKPNACNWTENTFRTKLSNIASVIAVVNPQIAVLVEVENENTVRELCKACAEQKCPFPYFAIGDQASGSSTRPVIVSKLPVLWEKSFGMVPGAQHERPMLEAAVYCGNDTLIVFANHWPSKKNQESRRVERAKILKSTTDALPASQDFIVAGDFNENYDESETFHTAGLDDTHGETGINHVLGTMVSAPNGGARYVLQPDLARRRANGFFDPWTSVAEFQRFSEMYQGRHETPDHILLPPSMFDEKGISYVDNSFHAFTWNGRLMKDGVPFRWQMRYAKHERIHVGDGFSDHLPVVLKLARRPYRPDDIDTSVIAAGSAGGGKAGGFEDGPDGFIACTGKIHVERDTLMPKSGRYCLKLSGMTKSNGCAARARLFIPKARGGGGGILALSLRGSGTINIRCGVPGSKKWTYFNGDEFSPAKGGKYFEYNFSKWKSIRLPLGSLSPDATEAEIEIRSKKACELRLWIDDVAVRCAP